VSLKDISAMILCLILTSVVFSRPARAGTYSEMTKLTFSGPVEIPGKILTAGTYWFVLMNDDADRNIVQVFNADRSQLEATLLTMPAVRQHWTAETEVKFAERPQHEPEALLKWFYPGQLAGHEFLYSRRHENEFARDVKRDELAEPTTLASNRVAPSVVAR